MQKQRGFTLIELLVVLAVTTVMIMLAAPSMRRLIQSNAMSGSVNTFLSDLRYARSEGIRRGGNVVMCRSDAPEASPPSCSAGAGPGNAGWASGWIVFHDCGAGAAGCVANGAFDAASDILLRVQAATSSVDQISDSPSPTVYQFTGTGRVPFFATAAQVHFGGSKFDTKLQRVVCVSSAGRARIVGDGTKNCAGGETE